MTILYYYKLESNHKDPVPPCRKWYGSILGSLICEKCKKIQYPQDAGFITILGLNPPPGNRIEGLLSWIGISIYHVDFIAQIEPLIRNYGYCMGECTDPQGDTVPDYVSCYTDKYVVQRGNEKTKYSICPECGSVKQAEWWHGRQYLLKSDIQDRKILLNASGSMYIADDLHKNLDYSRWRDATFEKILILDEPEDGRPRNLRSVVNHE